MKDNSFRWLPAILCTALFSAFASFLSPDTFAQELCDYSCAVQTNPYLTLANPAYFDRIDVKKMANAEVFFNKENGSLMPISGSPDSFVAGAATEAYVNISDRIAFYGKLSYSYFNGKRMGGQILMDSEDSPVNFLESVDTTYGVKVRELYNLSGGLTYSFSNRLKAGLRVDYQSGDQAKMKDPRSIDYLMDLNIRAGVNYSPSSGWDLGISAFFRNKVESVRGYVYGTTDKQYFIYTDKGGFWGVMEQLDGDYNYLPTSTLRQMFNDFCGLTLDFNHSSKVRSFNQISAHYRTGYYGNRTASLPVFFEFDGFEVSYDGAFLFDRGRNTHKVALKAGWSPLFNNENSFIYDTPAGKETVVVYNGQTQILVRHDISSLLSYSIFGGTGGGYRPEFILKADASFDYRTQTTTVYPEYRIHRYGCYSVDVSGEKTFLRETDNMYTAGGSLIYAGGFGTAAEDGSYGGGTTTLRSFDSWLYRDFEYLTAQRAGVGLSFTYTHIFNDKFALYFNLKDRFTALISEPVYLRGRCRNNMTLTAGFNF